MTRKTNQGGQSPSSSSPTSISLTSSQLFRISLFEIYTVFKQQVHSPQDDVFWDMNTRRADSLLLIGGEAEHLVFSPGSDDCWCSTRLRGWHHCPCYCSDPDYIPHHIDREIRPPCQAERPWSMFTEGLELSQINLYANGFVCECLVGSPGSSNKVTS